MRLENKRARASRQAKARAPKHTDSLTQRRRLTDEEWRDLWSKPDSIWWVGAVALLIAAAVGVI